MNGHAFASRIVYGAAVAGSVILLLVLLTFISIGYEAKRLCQEAKWEYRAVDCVTALTAQLDDTNQGYRTRNHAIWALGQYGDARALPVLRKYYTGTVPGREPLDETISQYELSKAIALANGGTNIAAWMWRGPAAK